MQFSSSRSLSVKGMVDAVEHRLHSGPRQEDTLINPSQDKADGFCWECVLTSTVASADCSPGGAHSADDTEPSTAAELMLQLAFTWSCFQG